MEVFLLHSLKYPLGSFLEFFQSFSTYQDIVHVDDEPSFCDHVSEGGVHNSLEGRWRVALAEEHHKQLIETIWSDECCFPLISFLDTNVVIPPLDIHLGEVFGSF